MSARQRGYDTSWEKMRRAHLLEHPLCVECQREGFYVGGKVVDHIVPHRGDQELLRDPTNLQTLCTKHHNQKTGRGE